MKKSLVVALVLLTSFIAPPAAQAQAQEPSTAEAIIVQEWMQALEARSQELNRAYGRGEYSPAIRAQKLRSEALNRQHGLGQYSPGPSEARGTGPAFDDRPDHRPGTRAGLRSRSKRTPGARRRRG